MKYFTYTLLFIFSCLLTVYPQKKELTVRQVTVGAKNIMPQELQQLQWRPSTDYFTFSGKLLQDTGLVQEGVDLKKPVMLVTLAELDKNYSELKGKQVKDFPEITWTDKDNFRFWQGNTLFKYNVTTGTLSEINETPDSAENKDISLKNFVAYTIKNNLYIAVNGKQYEITNDGNEGIVNGQYVARNEFGIDKGTFWSPGSRYLAFYRKDQTMVTDYPIVVINYRPAKVENIKYPMAGMTSEQESVGIYNLKTNEKLFLNTGKPKDHYLTGVTWDPGEKYVYIGVLNRDQNEFSEIKYDVSNGNPVDTLFKETNQKYVHPMHGPIFVEKHPDEFIWFSERDGWDHLYLYNTSGKLLKKLTEGNWDVIDFEGFDKSGENIFFTSTAESPLQSQYYKLNLNSGKTEKLTKGNGVHKVLRNDDGKYFIDTYSSLSIPYAALVINNNGETVKDIFTSKNPLSDYSIGKTKIFKLKSSDGYDLYCRMILPAGFDSTKKYPLLVYVYGGPGVQLITDRWLAGAGLWLNYMAEHGYVVFTLDNRGSANRGSAFEQETFRHLGTKEIEDQILGLNYVKNLPYIDTSRTGIFGWSFGGFMTTSLMTRTPGAFKVAVAGGSVIDWKYYEVMYTERYMDTPQANPEGYDQADLLNYVQNLKGKLLMIHGTSDPIVVWQHDLMFIKKAADLGVPVDYFVYPGQEHGVRGIDAFHLYNKITAYFNQYLMDKKTAED